MRRDADPKVLLTDGRNPSCLALARSLGRTGATVHVGESFKHHLTAYSKYIATSFEYPAPETNPQGFEEAVLERVFEEQFDVVIPVRDATSIAIANLSSEFPASTDVLLSEPEAIAELNDKAAVARLAERNGTPIPRTYTDLDEAKFESVMEEATFPVLIKPTRGSGARGIVRVEEPAQLPLAFELVSEEYDRAIVQEFVGPDARHYSIGTVFDSDATLRALHVYEELIQYPDSGGPAIKAVSVPSEPWVDEMVGFLENYEWIGPAHMDVLYDPGDETYKLLEVNPRIWMSMALTIESGIDVPNIIVRLANRQTLDIQPSYEPGVYYRWVLPNEVLWIASGKNPLQRAVGRLTDRQSPRCFGVYAADDRRSILGVLAQSAVFILDRDKRRFVLDRGWEPGGDVA